MTLEYFTPAQIERCWIDSIAAKKERRAELVQQIDAEIVELEKRLAEHRKVYGAANQ